MKRLLSTLLPIITCLSSFGQVVLYNHGPSTEYTDSGRSLRAVDGSTAVTTNDWNRAFSTTNLNQLSSNYTGPTFWGGYETTGSLAQTMDFTPQVASNQSAYAGGFDGPYFTLNNTTGSAGSHAFLMMGTTASTDLSDLSSFSIGAQRSTGAGNAAAAHAVIRIGSSYYVSGTGTSVGSSYVVQSLALSNWSTYDPATSISTIGIAASLNPTDQVDAVGFLLFRTVTDASPTGDVRYGVGQFTATAVPEPSTYALLAGMATLGLVLIRRRRG
jgi:hypothetical protein